MASIGPVTLTISRAVANAVVNVDYSVNFSRFDQATNLQYDVSLQLVGGEDDSQSDVNHLGDEFRTHDDLLPLPTLIARVRSNGSPTLQGNWNTTIAWAQLDDDPWSSDTDEVRARVTASPLLPATTTRESDLVDLGEINPRSQAPTSTPPDHPATTP